MKTLWRILLFCLLSFSVVYVAWRWSASATSKGDVSKNMVTLAKALYASSRNGVGDNKYIFDEVEVIEVGKNLGRGLPVKFKMKGIHGYKTQSSPPPDWNSNGFPIWVGETIEAEKPFSDTFVVFYTKNEFGNAVACSDGGFQCINEENMKQHTAMLEDMKTHHAIAKKQDTEQQSAYAQQQRNTEAQSILREQSKIPSVTLGTFPCIDHNWGMGENPPATGEAILTDVDVSYIDVGRANPVKVVFSFDNIADIEKTEMWGATNVNFQLRSRIQIRDGDEAGTISFRDISIRDAFFIQLIAAKEAWNQKYPELHRSIGGR